MKKTLLFILFITLILNGCMNKDDKKVDNNQTEINIDNNQTLPKERIYGKSKNIEITSQTLHNITIYKPINITHKLPFILFSPGWGSQNHNDYKTLLTFIASQGYIVIYSTCSSEYSADNFIENFETILLDNSVKDIIDINKIGIIGHSSGGGFTFKLLKHFSDNGYGNNGRFIFAADPWFAFEMSKEDFDSYPENTKTIIQYYGKNNSTDPRIPLTIFNQFDFLDDTNHDFQHFETLTHSYPGGSKTPDQMQLLLKPLDALMENVFLNDEKAKKVALEIGSDTPLQTYFQDILASNTYPYQCYDGNQNLLDTLDRYGLDYCDITID